MILIVGGFLTIGLLLQAFSGEGAKLLNTDKQLCRDLRNCQTYFPCRFLLSGNINVNLIEKCVFDNVFDEKKQQCVKAESLEDLECLVRANIHQLESIAPFTSTAAPVTTTSQTKTKFLNKKMASTVGYKAQPRHRGLVTTKSSIKSEPNSMFHAFYPFGFYSDEDEDEEISQPLSNKKPRDNPRTPPQKKAAPNQLENRGSKLKKKSSDTEQDMPEYVDEDEYYYDEDEASQAEESVEQEGKGKGRLLSVESKEKPQNSSQSEPEASDESSTDEGDDNKFKRMCTVTNWSQYRSGRGRFQFDFIESNLCNYIVYTSVKIEEEEDPDYEDFIVKGVQHNEKELYAKLKSLKMKNPSTKLILKVTDEGGRVFSKLSKSFDTRAIFVDNIVDYITTNGFDGIEIDWRWPNGASGTTDDKQNFILLLKVGPFLKDVHSTFNKKKILGIVMSPLTDRIQSSFNLLDINNIVDYVNVETFDYYGPWDKRVGIGAPLRKMDEQFLTESYMNIEGTITYLKASGLSADKIIMGLAVHARTYTLQVPHVNMVNAPTKGTGFSGSFTKTNGFLSYYELCEFQKKGKWKKEWHALASAPYMHNSDGEWVYYEDEDSLKEKIEFVKSNELAGVSVNSIDLDDFSGSFCDKGPYPFLRYTLALLMKRPKMPQNVFMMTSSTKKTVLTPRPKSSSAKSIPVTPKALSRKNSTQGSPIKDVKKHINSATPKQSEKNPLKSAKTSAKPSPNKVSTSTPGYILITPPKIEGHETLKNWQERLSAQYRQELKNKMARISATQASTPRNKHQKKQDVMVSQVQVQLPSPPARLLPSTRLQNPYKNESFVVISPSKSKPQLVASNQNNNNINTNQIIKSSKALALEKTNREIMEKKLSDDLALRQRQDNELKRLEEQILRWQMDAKKWMMQLKNHQKQEETIADVQAQQQRLNQQHQQQNYHPLPQPTQSPPPTPPPPPSPPKQAQSWPSETGQHYQQPVHVVMQPGPVLPPLDTRCNGKLNAIYRDEYDCGAFYICEISTTGQSRTHTFKCPPGLIFNMDECTCDWALPNRPCVVPLAKNFCKMTGPDNESSRSSSGSYQAVYQRVEPPLPPLPTWPSAFTCENREKGLYRDPYDCSKFYYCQILATAGLTIKHDFSCPHGLHFNLYNCQCDWPFNSNCNVNGVSTLCTGF